MHNTIHMYLHIGLCITVHSVECSRVEFGSLQSSELAPDAERTDSLAKHCYYPTTHWVALPQQPANVECESDQLCGSQLSWHHVFNPPSLILSLIPFYQQFPILTSPLF